MPFIPHTDDDIRAMLDAIGVGAMEDLFDEIPGEMRVRGMTIPPALSEVEVMRLMRDRARLDGEQLNFIGAGAYEHHVPAAVWQIATRGEFYSAYTPYQAEASQGTLQVLYEYQSMMCALTGLDVTNASLYDGASALAEAVLMAVRSHKSSRRVLMPSTVHPMYRNVVRTLVSGQDIEIHELPYCTERGYILPESLNAQALQTTAGQEFAGLVIPQPNFFGALERVDELTDWAHAQGGMVIAVVNPLSLALLKAPGTWGKTGADIAAGEGQPLGVPLSGGGPYFGFLACKQAYLRQMPGRIVGRTLDHDGKPGFTLTLQAREQHIRRSKATSNICTNQGLAVTAAAIHMSIMGTAGLRRAAAQSHQATRNLMDLVTRIEGVRKLFAAPHFNECVIGLPAPASQVLERMLDDGVVAGFDLAEDYPELGPALLVCATEVRTAADLETYATSLARALNN
jgi:glycine dehydrogenase subunit 1